MATKRENPFQRATARGRQQQNAIVNDELQAAEPEPVAGPADAGTNEPEAVPVYDVSSENDVHMVYDGQTGDDVQRSNSVDAGLSPAAESPHAVPDAKPEAPPATADSARVTDNQPEELQFDVTLRPERTGRRRRGRPVNIQVRVPFTTRVRADVRKKINIGAATYDVKPSDIIDALVDQFWDSLDWERVGVDRH